ncbi:MAG: LuxR C-terminal-related transcriptional regulator [Luteolibacter sp.]
MSGGREAPDISLLDLHLPDVGGLEAIPHFSTEIPGAKIITLTRSNREELLLSKREVEVLTMLAEVCVKKEIADRLHISSSTVVSHVAHAFKLDASRSADWIDSSAIRDSGMDSSRHFGFVLSHDPLARPPSGLQNGLQS